MDWLVRSVGVRDGRGGPAGAAGAERHAAAAAVITWYLDYEVLPVAEVPGLFDQPPSSEVHIPAVLGSPAG